MTKTGWPPRPTKCILCPPNKRSADPSKAHIPHCSTPSLQAVPLCIFSCLTTTRSPSVLLHAAWDILCSHASVPVIFCVIHRLLEPSIASFSSPLQPGMDQCFPNNTQALASYPKAFLHSTSLPTYTGKNLKGVSSRASGYEPLGDLSLGLLVTVYKGSSVHILFLQILLLEQFEDCRGNTKLSGP